MKKPGAVSKKSWNLCVAVFLVQIQPIRNSTSACPDDDPNANFFRFLPDYLENSLDGETLFNLHFVTSASSPVGQSSDCLANHFQEHFSQQPRRNSSSLLLTSVLSVTQWESMRDTIEQMSLIVILNLDQEMRSFLRQRSSEDLKEFHWLIQTQNKIDMSDMATVLLGLDYRSQTRLFVSDSIQSWRSRLVEVYKIGEGYSVSKNVLGYFDHGNRNLQYSASSGMWERRIDLQGLRFRVAYKENFPFIDIKVWGN